MSEPPTSKRLTILTADEIDALYARPIFTPEERLEYFELTPPEQVSLSQLRTPTIQIYFILQLAILKPAIASFVLHWRMWKQICVISKHATSLIYQLNRC
jgi:hypothetical protein